MPFWRLFSQSPSAENSTRLCVVGVGGGGGAAINRMVYDGPAGVEFIAVDTDAEDLAACNAQVHICIGERLTDGAGAGGRPELGQGAADESADALRELLRTRT